MQSTEADSHALKNIAKALGAQVGQDKPKRHSSIFQWCIAWDRYAIAANATKQMTFASAMAHKDICMQAAMKAKSKGCRQWFAICYDEIARRTWEELAFADDSTFDINKAAKTMSETFLMEAETLYHSMEASNKFEQQHSVGFSSKGPNAKGYGKHERGGSLVSVAAVQVISPSTAQVLVAKVTARVKASLTSNPASGAGIEIVLPK